MLNLNNLPPFADAASIPPRVLAGEPFAPTFMIHGNEDTLVPVENATRLCDAIAGESFETTSTDGGEYNCGPESKLRVIDGANHILDMKCFSANIDPGILEALQSHVDSFEAAVLCPSGAAGVAPTQKALNDAFRWLN